MEKNLIIFTDSGDTLIDEGTEVRNEEGIVIHAKLIPGAKEALQALYEEGYRIALVADGDEQSFTNVYLENGLSHCFYTRSISEIVGEVKPSARMFQDAMDQNGLTEADKGRIIMVGNNLRRDIIGANRFGLTSVLLDWSPRYDMTPGNDEEKPDYIIHTPSELPALVKRLELEWQAPRKQASATPVSRTLVCQKLTLLADSFQKVLYEEDSTFLENMKTNSLASDDFGKYQFWEWTQGVGLFGFWKYYELSRDEKYLRVLEKYYSRQLKLGLPAKNVNTVTPLLALSFYADAFQRAEYLEVCREWAEWIMNDFPRTQEGGLQHITSDSVNEEELWDDTLFMTVLFLAHMGKLLNRQDYIEEAIYQFLLHVKYLADPDTGLWYHGWTFKERNHFAGAFWGRGNCWITAAIPELISMGVCTPAVERYLAGVLKNQVDALERLQEEDGMWHTLVDDRTSYVEASATAGFAYGIEKAVNMGLLDVACRRISDRALDAILGCVTEEGIVTQVSYGTPMGRESREFYKNIPLKSMPYGQALAMLFFMEWLNRKQGEKSGNKFPDY